MKKTKWLDGSILPVHIGTYEVQSQDGAIVRLAFSREGWLRDPKSFSRWRGRNVLLGKSAGKKRQASVAAHADSPKRRVQAAKSALRLARHSVATGQDAFARSLWYEIATRLGAGLDEADHVQRLQAGLALSSIGKKQISAGLKQLGIPAV